MFLRRFSFSYAFWFFSLKNLSQSKVGERVVVEILWALVFQTMMLRIKRTDTKETEREEKKNQGQTTGEHRKKI